MRAHGSIHAPRRWLLPLLAIVAVALVARWLSWPGLATHDTVWSTREAVLGRYTTYHPLLNALLLRALAVPFESYAVYTSLQIVLCAALFFRSLRLVAGGAGQMWPVWLSISIWGLSLHTVLFLGLVWKDVPIAYGLCFIAALAFAVRRNPAVQVRRIDALLLGVSVFLCVGLRHGMAFNLVLVPLLLGAGRFLRDRRLWVPVAAALAGFLLLSVLSRSSLVSNNDVHLLKLKISAVSQPFLGAVSNKNGYTSDDYGYDERLAARVFGAGYAANYSPDYFRNDIVPQSAEELRMAYKAILMRTATLCLLNVSQCVSGRVQMMLSTMQPSTRFGGMTFYDLGSHGDCSVVGMDVQRCDLLQRFATSERLASADRALAWLLPRFVDTRGAIHNLLVWNLLPALALIAAILIWLAPRHPLWIVGAFFTAQLVLPFASAMANDFRYYYFLFPFLVVFGPVLLRELAGGRGPTPPGERTSIGGSAGGAGHGA